MMNAFSETRTSHSDSSMSTQDGPLLQLVYNRLINNQEERVSSQKACRAINFLNSAFFLPLAIFDFAENQTAPWNSLLYRRITIYSASTIVGLSSTWAMFRVLQAFFAPKTKNEQVIEATRISPKLPFIIKSLCLMMGFGSYFPEAFYSYKNSKDPLDGLLKVAEMIPKTFFPVYSLHLISEKIFIELAHYHLNPQERVKKWGFLQILQDKIQTTLSGDAAYVRSVSLHETGSHDMDINRFLTLSQREINTAKSYSYEVTYRPKNRCAQATSCLGQTIIRFLGLLIVLGGSFNAFKTQESYSDALLKNQDASYALAGFQAAFSLPLEYLLVDRLFQRFSKKLTTCFSCRKIRKNIIVYSKTETALKTLFILLSLSLCLLIPNLPNLEEDKNGVDLSILFIQFILIASYLKPLFLSLEVIFQMIDTFIASCIHLCGDKETKDLAYQVDCLKKTYSMVQNSNISCIRGFLYAIDLPDSDSKYAASSISSENSGRAVAIDTQFNQFNQNPLLKLGNYYSEQPLPKTVPQNNQRGLTPRLKKFKWQNQGKKPKLHPTGSGLKWHSPQIKPLPLPQKQQTERNHEKHFFQDHTHFPKLQNQVYSEQLLTRKGNRLSQKLQDWQIDQIFKSSQFTQQGNPALNDNAYDILNNEQSIISNSFEKIENNSTDEDGIIFLDSPNDSEQFIKKKDSI